MTEQWLVVSLFHVAARSSWSQIEAVAAERYRITRTTV